MKVNFLLKGFLLRLLTQKKTTTFDIKNSKKVLFLRYDRIGDMVISSAVFRELKFAYPKIKVIVIASKTNKGVLINNPYIDEIIINNKNNLLGDLVSLIKLRNQRIDVCIEFDHSVVPHAIYRLKIINPKKIISVKKDGRYGVKGNELMLYDYYTEKPINQHLKDIWLNCLAPFEIEPKSDKYDLFISSRQDQEAKNQLKKYSSSYLIGINIEGAVKGKKINSIDLEKICKALSRLNLTIIIICHPDKMLYTSKLLKSMNLSYVNLSYKTESILDLAALIKNLNFIITPDTSVSHIASAYNKPVITIHEDNLESYKLFAPTSRINKTIFSNKKNSLEGFPVDELITETFELIKLDQRQTH
jgi:ADP-heptose:LPS heptosyltransferase